MCGMISNVTNRGPLRIFVALALLSLTSPVPTAGQAFAPYAARSQFLQAAPGSLGSGSQGYVNPAVLTYVEHPTSTFAWTDRPGGDADWGSFIGLPNLGFGVIHRGLPGEDLNDYEIALADGHRGFGLGVGYGWSSGGATASGRRHRYTIGALARPLRQLSIGLTYTTARSSSARELAGEFALRPLGSPRLTLFGEVAAAAGGAPWSLGAVWQVAPGLHLSTRYFNNETISAGFALGFGHASLRSHGRRDDAGRIVATYAVQFSAYEHTFLDQRLPRPPTYLELDLNRPIRHRSFALFDPGAALVDLLALIERAQDDPRIAGIAINTSGMRANPTNAWELRQRLEAFKTTGKPVVAYVDRADIGAYHFVSVADHIILDPAGLIVLEGYLIGQTYAKGALGKIGIGFEELRLFEFKSAAETLSREDMSAAEREQLQALIDDFYALARTEICSARDLDEAGFDRLVDEETLLMPDRALEYGLVDQLGRWDQVEELLEQLAGKEPDLIEPERFSHALDRNWGRRPRVALIYALGMCAMDSGIGARRLVGEIDAIAEDDGIAAAVLRVDSPGGDVLPSDLVADAIRKLAEKKPVIVSQGYVAASGGYWLSMYGHQIVAAPNTVTGSIGVIAGWIYNEGMKERLGLSTDYVKVGDHADLGFGMTLPLIGVTLPDRKLTEAERDRLERLIRTLYGDFVDKVASGRGRPAAEIEELAQGRVWSGTAALQRGLVDRLGGLEVAIELARERAGIDADAHVELVEYPRRGLLDPGFLSPRLVALLAGHAPAAPTTESPLMQQLLFRLDHNGEPLLLLPLNQFATLLAEPG